MFVLLFDIIIRRFSVDVAGGVKSFAGKLVNKFGVHKQDKEKRRFKNRKKSTEVNIEEDRNVNTVNDTQINVEKEMRKSDVKTNKKTEDKKKNDKAEQKPEMLDMNALLQKKKDRS